MSDGMWIGHLGNANQWRDVPHIEISGKQVRCKLCNTGWMPPASRRTHLNGSEHKRKHSEIQTDGEELHRLKRLRTLDGRVGRLGLPAWQRHVKELMYNYIRLSMTGPLLFVDVTRKLELYEKMEQVSLLELAIWKARICDGLFFCSVDEMKEYTVLEEGFDVKAYAQKLRITSGCAVIIPGVHKFL